MESNDEKIIRLLNISDLKASKECLRLMIELYLEVGYSLKDKGYPSARMAESGVWLQMIMTNAMSISKLLSGSSIQSNPLSSIIDHQMIFTLTRRMYESLLAFEILYIVPDTEDKRSILYGMFLAAGYREKLGVLSKEQQEKFPEKTRELEKWLEGAIKNVKNTDLYKTLSNNNRQKIDNGLLNSKFRYVIDENLDVRFVDWPNGADVLKFKPDLFNTMYKYFSNLAHPTHYGLLQFAQSFEGEDPEYTRLATFGVRLSLIFMSVFMQDYSIVVPEVQGLLAVQDEVAKRVLFILSKSARV